MYDTNARVMELGAGKALPEMSFDLFWLAKQEATAGYSVRNIAYCFLRQADTMKNKGIYI